MKRTAICLVTILAFACNATRRRAVRTKPTIIWYSLSVTAESMAQRNAFIATAVPGDATVFEAPLSYGGAPVFLQFLVDITATTTGGRNLDVERRHNQVVVNHGVNVPERFTLRYTYRVPQSKSGEVNLSLPTLDSAHGRFDGNLTFLTPRGYANAPARLQVSTPENMPAHHSWGSASTTRVDSVRHLVSGMIAFGDFRYTVETAGETTVRFALRGEYDEMKLRDQFGAILRAQQEIAGPLPSSRLLVVVQDSTSTECKGTALTNAFVVNMQSGTPLEPFNFQAMGTVSHELFHEWNLHYVSPKSDDGAYLLSEGFTNYFAVAALVRARLISPERFARFLWRYRQLLEANPRYPGADFTQIQSGFLTNDSQLIDLAYSKGPFVAILLDLALRDETNGVESVTSWFQQLVKEFGGKNGYSVTDLRDLTARLSGAPGGRAVSAFDQAFLGGSKLELDAIFQRLGISCTEQGDCKLARSSDAESELRRRMFSATR